jgi:hypothetical protein
LWGFGGSAKIAVEKSFLGYLLKAAPAAIEKPYQGNISSLISSIV